MCMCELRRVHLTFWSMNVLSYSFLDSCQEVKKRLSSDAAAAANRSGRWKDQMRKAAYNGCCRRVAQTRALYYVMWKLLESEKLVEPLVTVEMQLVRSCVSVVHGKFV